MDRYAYTNNNPVRYADPTGHCSFSITYVGDPNFAYSCLVDVKDAVDAYISGERNTVKLIARAAGLDDLARETGEAVNQLNADMATVLSNKSWQERLPASINVGVTSVTTAASMIGAGQLASAGARSLGTARLQAITNAANTELGINPTIARNVLSEAEYAIGQQQIGIARMQYGNAVERLVSQEIAQSPFDRMFFSYVGGRSNPDFIGRGILRGMNFDITTPGQIAAHLTRPGYGQGLNVITYLRPNNFLFFP